MVVNISCQGKLNRVNETGIYNEQNNIGQDVKSITLIVTTTYEVLAGQSFAVL